MVADSYSNLYLLFLIIFSIAVLTFSEKTSSPIYESYTQPSNTPKSAPTLIPKTMGLTETSISISNIPMETINKDLKWYTQNKINYNLLDYQVRSLENQMNDILGRWPTNFTIGNVTTKNSSNALPTGFNGFNQCELISQKNLNWNNLENLPTAYITGSMPENICINFTFPQPSNGNVGLKGEQGEKGDIGPVGPMGPVGPQGYWQ